MEQVSHGNKTAYTQMKLFSPPVMEQSIEDSSVVLNTVKELQACLNIVDSFVAMVNSIE